MSKRLGIVSMIFILALAVSGIYWYVCSADKPTHSNSPIKVGVLHSLSGTMAISEKLVADATLLAIEEINEAGGVLGRQLIPVVADGKSDDSTFAKKAEELIVKEGVAVVFGCWTSASRKSVKPIFERHNHLLFYPVQYEGLEESPNIIYTGASPNQQLLPAVKWSSETLGKRFFLVGSDYVFPRTANAIVKDQVRALKGEVVGEEYLPLGSSDVKSIVDKIIEAKPDIILNTINGDSNSSFFSELRARGVKPTDIPTMSFSIAEAALKTMNPENMVGDYACWNYFQSVDTEENHKFVKAFKNRYGQDCVTSDPMEAAYFGVYLWAKAAIRAGSPEAKEVLSLLPGESFDAPEGLVHIDGENHHTWKRVIIGKINDNSQFDIVWSTERTVRPIPYPSYRSKAEWDSFLVSLYKGWMNRWARPEKE